MSQVFPKNANAWSKASLITIMFLLIGGGWAVLTLQRSDLVTGANEFIEQPVQFSHQHHVGGIGIECRYCHTSVEVSPSAGIPPTKTCMGCHTSLGATIDKTFSFPRKVDGHAGWGYINLRGMRTPPTLARFWVRSPPTSAAWAAGPSSGAIISRTRA